MEETEANINFALIVNYHIPNFLMNYIPFNCFSNKEIFVWNCY